VDTGDVFLVRPDLIHLIDIETTKRGIECVVRLVHFFNALLQHEDSLPEK
jgi:hypothetical protein